MKNLSNIRTEYKKGRLDETNLPGNPVDMFKYWLQQAINADVQEATAMTLSTVSENKPSSRVVLLKEITQNLIFFTNYDSRKGKELEKNPNAALNFFWAELERQIRIEGIINKVEPEISDQYFQKRPVKSQISAIISPQSSKISSREELQKKIESFTPPFKRPANWGGYQLKPVYFEFWQGRENRLHDRIEYYLENERWIISRLAP